MAFLTDYGRVSSARWITYSDLGQLNLGLGRDLGDAELGQFLALSGEFLGEALLVFGSQLVRFHSLNSLHFA